MDKRFEPSVSEPLIGKFWIKAGLTRPKSGKPFTILMPPPNANASLHAGHGMYTVDDILVRYKRIMGYASLWVPGMDHAGFETQFVYEKHLRKQDKSRLDFDRSTLYDQIEEFVKENSGLIYSQFQRLGFLADWERSVFTLNPAVLERVYQTFRQMVKEDLVYRDDYIVNYCNYCGTSLSELEVKYIERTDPLYYLKYGPFVLATVRPETKFGDTALAVHPEDERYRQWIGKTVEAEGLLGKFSIKVIADTGVDPKFGTGVVKITPAHDPHDFEMGKRHNLEVKKVINIDGRLNELAGPYQGLKVKVARAKIVEDLKKHHLIEKIDDKYTHSVTVCYKCGRDLEPTVIPNWFIKVDQLKQPAIKAIREGKVKFYPARFKKQILDWLDKMHDWPISRQIAWGIRIPAWYDLKTNPQLYLVFLNTQGESIKGYSKELLVKYSYKEIASGLQSLTAPVGSKFVISVKAPEGEYLQETDTFDTWFSSGQWPLVTLSEEEYKTRFPTDFLGTLSDILPFWVSRMIMFSLYVKNEVPFKQVYLWSMVADSKGQKMSKSKGNVINPIELVDKYGADALRAALLFGVSAGSKVPLADDKVRAMRNFANKVWNIARFIYTGREGVDLKEGEGLSQKTYTGLKKELSVEYQKLVKDYHQAMDHYQLSTGLGILYEFIWHRLADYYLEALKDEVRNDKMGVLPLLFDVLVGCLRMLHPFMPFVTEAIYQNLTTKNASLLVNNVE